LKRPVFIIFVILLADQLLKFWVKTTMYLGQEYRIADWFILHFTENNGMAFGMEFGGEYGKLALSLFRIVFVGGISVYLYRLVKTKADPFYITCIALIIAGATGNIIDSTFYGIIFSSSDFQLAQFMPAEGGYSSLFHGKVVDMFYFPLIRGQFPVWFPIWSEEPYLFFRPVFNLADSSISIGVMMMILFQKRFFGEHNKDISKAEAPETQPEA
jgi:signal peptidase II